MKHIGRQCDCRTEKVNSLEFSSVDTGLQHVGNSGDQKYFGIHYFLFRSYSGELTSLSWVVRVAACIRGSIKAVVMAVSVIRLCTRSGFLMKNRLAIQPIVLTAPCSSLSPAVKSSEGTFLGIKQPELMATLSCLQWSHLIPYCDILDAQTLASCSRCRSS